MRKVNLLKYFVVFLYVLVISRLIYLTIYKNDYYSYKKEDINNNIISIGSYPRGRILDINGNILVDNKGVNSVIYKDDKKINKFDIVDKLYNILEINNINVTKEMKYKYLYDKYKNVFDNRLSIDILNKYNNREITKYDLLNYKYSLIDDSLLDNVNIKKVYLYYLITSGYGYEYKTIKNNISDIELDYINNANIPGISVITNYVRVYNYDTCLNTLFGDIGNIHKEDKEYYLSLGYSLDDIVGVSFLEKYYESYLKGEKSKYKLLENGELELINNYKKGNDLVLNIDINLQMRIEEEVKKEMIETKKYVSSKYYNGSYLVISNPNNGDIISLIG